MSLLTEKLLREMFACDGIIIRHKGMDTWPIRPRGDGRKRPIAWIVAADAMSLLRDEVLERTPKGLALSAQTRRRLRFGTAQQELEAGETYAPHGGLRPVRRNIRSSVVDRLSRQRDRKGEPLLSAAQIEAMHRFTAEFKRAEGRPQSSCVGQSRVDTSPSSDATENQVLARIDAGSQLRKAQAALGPEFSRLLGKVCGANETLNAIERAESWSRGSGLTLLRLGLDRLIHHYGTVPGQSYRRKAG